MQYLNQVLEKVCRKLLKFDRKIRYVALLGSDGRIAAGGMRRGIPPLEPTSEDLRLAVHISGMEKDLGTWDRYYGKTLYHIVRREFVSFLVTRCGKFIFLMSAEPDFPLASFIDVRDLVLEKADVIEKARLGI